jgi:hypothetical protein
MKSIQSVQHLVQEWLRGTRLRRHLRLADEAEQTRRETTWGVEPLDARFLRATIREGPSQRGGLWRSRAVPNCAVMPGGITDDLAKRDAGTPLTRCPLQFEPSLPPPCDAQSPARRAAQPQPPWARAAGYASALHDDERSPLLRRHVPPGGSGGGLP